VRAAVAEVVEKELAGFIRRGRATWTYSENDLEIRVWRDRYHKERPVGFGFRDVVLSVSQRGIPIAGGSLREWRGPPLADIEEFFWEADDLSLADGQSADIVRKLWSDDPTPFDYGNVVRFDRLAIMLTSKSAAIWSLVSRAIRKEFMRRGSLLLLKAFPLEFEGEGSTDHDDFRRRASAMRRHYERRLGVRSVPGRYGAEGWMWRPLRHCPQPRLETRKLRRPRSRSAQAP
jgi:hypothetical protein